MHLFTGLTLKFETHNLKTQNLFSVFVTQIQNFELFSASMAQTQNFEFRVSETQLKI